MGTSMIFDPANLSQLAVLNSPPSFWIALKLVPIISSDVPGISRQELLFDMFVNFINDYLSSAKALSFLNDVKLFLKKNSPSDLLLIQSDLDSLYI